MTEATVERFSVLAPSRNLNSARLVFQLKNLSFTVSPFNVLTSLPSGTVETTPSTWRFGSQLGWLFSSATV